MKPFFSAVLALLLLAGAALAVEPSEMLPDPAQEARARALSKALRCVECQSENIDESNAEIARDMRLLVRRRIVAGDTDAQVLSYMQSRYGDFILMQPRLKSTTVLLWAGPAGLLVIGAFVLVVTLRRRRVPPPPLTPAESETLTRLGQTGDAGTAP